MDEATPLNEIPLSYSHGQGQHIDPHLDTTYGRYERAPFRQYSERRIQDQAPLFQKPRRLQSQDSMLRRVLSRRSRPEQTVRSTTGRDGDGERMSHSNSGISRKVSRKNKPEPSYTLAGPRQQPSAQVETDYDDEEEHDGGRPKPNWGLAKPFPHKNRRGRKTKKQDRGAQRKASGHPEGQVNCCSRSVGLFVANPHHRLEEDQVGTMAHRYGANQLGKLQVVQRQMLAIQKMKTRAGTQTT